MLYRALSTHTVGWGTPKTADYGTPGLSAQRLAQLSGGLLFLSCDERVVRSLRPQQRLCMAALDLPKLLGVLAVCALKCFPE